MPAASIITTYLNPPFTRKVGFHNAFKQAMQNAGFPATDVDDYDIRDTRLGDWQGGTVFNAGNDGSVKGFVKELTYNATSNGTVGMGCFTRTVYSSGVGGSNSTVLPYADTAFMAGGFVYTGGWNSTLKQPSSASSGKTIGGYCHNQSFTSSLAHGDTYVSDGNNGLIGYPFYSASNSTYKRQCILSPMNPIKFVAINHPEIRGVYIHQMDKVPYFIGICKPANPPSWLNENSFPYAFMGLDSSFFSYQSFTGSSSPFNTGVGSGVVVNAAGMGMWYAYTHANQHQQGMGFDNSNNKQLNPINPGNSSKRDVIPGPHMFNTGAGAGVNSGKWLFGQYSNDAVVTLSHGLQLFDKIIISPGTEEYMVLSTPEFQNFSDGNNPCSTKLSPVSAYYSYYSFALRTA